MLDDVELDLIFDSWHTRHGAKCPNREAERQAYRAGYRAKERADDYTSEVTRRVQAIIDKTFGRDEPIRILPVK